MATLLVVDPLDLSLSGPDGEIVWSTRHCFERAVADLAGIEPRYCTGRDSELCRLAAASDGVVLGGSEASAWQDSAFNDHLLDLIAICRNGEIPFLGICYGAQLLGRALGGIVGRHPGGMELGAASIRLTAEGERHFMFRGTRGGKFRSVETHADALFTLPPGCDLLASTDHTPVQAFSYQDLLCGVQFHPEMEGRDLRCLWKAFAASGVAEPLSPELEASLASCVCPSQARVLRNFARGAAGRRGRKRGRHRSELTSARSS